eukprot:10210997-Alexandrium_andersonii.AAC.1
MCIRDRDEELEDLPAAEKELDPLSKAVVRRVIDGEMFIGHVQDIDCGRISKERFYRVRYTDGHLGHLTKDQVESMRIKDEGGPGA